MEINVTELKSSQLLLTLMVVSQLTYALESYRFNKGSNVSIDFAYQLDGSYLACELFSLDTPHPFYVNKQIDPTALRSDQQGRFSATTVINGTYLRVTLHIEEIQESDSNVYILTIRETKYGELVDHIMDAQIRVIHPPGKATCHIIDFPNSSPWCMVNCQALHNINRDGNIICYQDLQKVPIFKSNVSPAKIRTIFLMQNGSAIKCCSCDVNQDKDPKSCSDFEYNPPNDYSQLRSVTSEQTEHTQVIHQHETTNSIQTQGGILEFISTKALPNESVYYEDTRNINLWIILITVIIALVFFLGMVTAFASLLTVHLLKDKQKLFSKMNSETETSQQEERFV